MHLSGVDRMTFPLPTVGVADKEPLALVFSVTHNLRRNEHRNKRSV